MEGTIAAGLFFDPAGWWWDLGLGVGAGVALLALWEAARRWVPASRELEDRLREALGSLTGQEALGLAFVSGFAEEFFFRGVVQGAWGWLPATLLFTLLHTGPGSGFRLWTLFAAVAGLGFAALMLWRGNLLAPFVAHALVNGVNLRRMVLARGEPRAGARI